MEEDAWRGTASPRERSTPRRGSRATTESAALGDDVRRGLVTATSKGRQLATRAHHGDTARACAVLLLRAEPLAGGLIFVCSPVAHARRPGGKTTTI